MSAEVDVERSRPPAQLYPPGLTFLGVWGTNAWKLPQSFVTSATEPFQTTPPLDSAWTTHAVSLVMSIVRIGNVVEEERKVS